MGMCVAIKVNTGFDIVPVPGGNCDFVTLYTYRLVDEDKTALDDFLNATEVKQAPDLNRLLGRLERMKDELGIYDKRVNSWLRDEGNGTSALWAPIPEDVKGRYPKPPPGLRLYCFRFDEHEYTCEGEVFRHAPILLLGNGGVKRTRRLYDDKASRVYKAHREIRQIRKAVNGRFEEGGIWITDEGFTLKGNLRFETL